MDYVPYIFSGVLLVYLSAFMWYMTRIERRKREKNSQRKNRLFKTLSAGLKTGAVTTIDDVVNVFKGISDLTSEDVTYRYGLSSDLREYLVYIVSNEGDLTNESLSEDTVREWKEKVTKFINQNEAISPYSDLPSAERNILSDMASFLDRNDTDAVKRKTTELAAMIQARSSSLDKIQSTNRWTVPLAVIGFILTVTFGILAWIR